MTILFSLAAFLLVCSIHSLIEWIVYKFFISRRQICYLQSVMGLSKTVLFTITPTTLILFALIRGPWWQGLIILVWFGAIAWSFGKDLIGDIRDPYYLRYIWTATKKYWNCPRMWTV